MESGRYSYFNGHGAGKVSGAAIEVLPSGFLVDGRIESHGGDDIIDDGIGGEYLQFIFDNFFSIEYIEYLLHFGIFLSLFLSSLMRILAVVSYIGVVNRR